MTDGNKSNPDLKYEAKSVLQRFDFKQLEEDAAREEEMSVNRVWRVLGTPCLRGSLLIGVTVSLLAGVAYQLKTKRDPVKLIVVSNLLASFGSWKTCQYMHWVEQKRRREARAAKDALFRAEMAAENVAPEDQYQWMLRRYEKEVDQFAKEHPEEVKKHKVQVRY